VRQQILCGVAIALCHAGAGFVNGDVITGFELDFASTPGAHLSFSGHNGTFTFTPDSHGHEFQIQNVSGGTGSALGLYGTISGTFTIGNVVNNEAPVTGNGVLTISDGFSHNLTANVTFLAIDKMGSLGELNPNQMVDLTNVHYTGTNQDLLNLVHSQNPDVTLDFFSSQTLAQLKSGEHAVNTGFAGAIDPALPEPGTMTIFLGAMTLIGGFRLASRRRQAAGAAVETAA
jgi:hypothetical protein